MYTGHSLYSFWACPPSVPESTTCDVFSLADYHVFSLEMDGESHGNSDSDMESLTEPDVKKQR